MKVSSAVGGDLFGNGIETLLRRVFLGGDGGARLGETGGPSSLGIVHWSNLPPFTGVVSLLTYLSGLFGRHTVLRAVWKPKMRPVGFCAATLRACGRDHGEPRTVPT